MMTSKFVISSVLLIEAASLASWPCQVRDKTEAAKNMESSNIQMVLNSSLCAAARHEVTIEAGFYGPGHSA